MKHRLLRVNELVKRELSGIIAREISFDSAIVTVNHVDVAPDLKPTRLPNALRAALAQHLANSHLTRSNLARSRGDNDNHGH